MAEHLVEHQGCWIAGFQIACPEVGGSEGLKRLRELRTDGWPIIKRKSAGSTAYEYCLPLNAEFE